jgi:hypothetical protein
MSPWRDLESEMQRLPLDTDTADRLLAGSVAPEDAPPGYGGVATLLAAVADSPAGGDFSRESETVGLIAAVVRSSQPKTTKPRRRSIVPRLRLATAFATVALAVTTGLAFAGSLPGAAQDVASTMLDQVGVSVPGPDSNAGDHPNVRGKSSDAPVTSSNSGKGGEISDLATSTDLTGVEKGAAISTLASMVEATSCAAPGRLPAKARPVVAARATVANAVASLSRGTIDLLRGFVVLG